MNNKTNLSTNLKLNINERLTLEQRQSLQEYDAKMALLHSIHAEIDATKPKTDGFDNSDVDGNNTRYVGFYNVSE